MKSVHTVILCISICLLTRAYSQTVLAEFDLESARIDGIQVFPLYDSIFVSLLDRGVKSSYWIKKGGEKREVDLMIPPHAPIVGITSQADHTLYYYLNDIDGQMLLGDPPLRQLIDQYEVLQTSGKKKDEGGWDLLFKGYTELSDGAIGIYQQKGRKITLVKYP